MKEYMPYGKVLLADDVDANIFITKGLLISYGVKIETATNGFEAVEKIKNGEVYDIILMDYFMPKMDGMEAVKIIRSLGYTQPIIALTANALKEQNDELLEAGFDEVIFKPIDIRYLDVLLNKHICSKQPPEVIEAARREKAALGGQ